jgi:hypothetical protein
MLQSEDVANLVRGYPIQLGFAEPIGWIEYNPAPEIEAVRKL